MTMIKRCMPVALVFLLLLSQHNATCQEKRLPELFPLSSVRLLDGPFKHACDLNIEALLTYDVDRLLAPYLREAGLTPKAESFPNWAGLDGHIGGHYLSAMAIHYAATGNLACKERMEYMVSELERCHDIHGNGYLGGQPDALEEVYLQVKAGDPEAVTRAWVPWYNLHKVYAGLRDAWIYGKNETAKNMFLDLCDWGLTIIAPLDAAQMEKMLDTEFGGMNEVYADAYDLTGDKKYLDAARRFTHHALFDSMVERIDNLDNKHANTQVPKAVGFQRVAELSGDERYATAAQFFWETVVNNRSLSFGGNSRREHFPSAAACREYTEEREGPESCNTYNMLKLTEGLFRMEPQARYADYYERAMYNHILSTQHPGHGGYVYFTSARPRHYRVYSAPNKAMWCCVGTGMENHGKYGEFIYSHTKEDLYVNLFVASELEWHEKGITVRQETDFPFEKNSKLTLTLDRPEKFTLLVRHPAWVGTKDFSVKINGKVYRGKSAPSSYLEIKRRWRTGDIIEVILPMKTTLEEMPNVPDYISILHGPILLGARSGNEDLHGIVAGEGRWGHIARGPLRPITEAPLIVDDRSDILEKLENLQPVKGNPLHFICPELFRQSNNKAMVLEPFFGIHDSRYIIYWPTMTDKEFETMKREREQAEERRMKLDQRTVDKVKPGEQQPEADHLMEESGSGSDYYREESFRHAGDGGYFSYNLLTGGEEDLRLMVRYWGNENGYREFDIFIDNRLLTTENLVGKWNRNEFIDVEYPIPAAMVKGKDSIRVRFQSKENSMAGGVYFVRLLKTEQAAH
jgi:DUF1680 family protein